MQRMASSCGTLPSLPHRDGMDGRVTSSHRRIRSIACLGVPAMTDPASRLGVQQSSLLYVGLVEGVVGFLGGACWCPVLGPLGRRELVFLHHAESGQSRFRCYSRRG